MKTSKTTYLSLLILAMILSLGACDDGDTKAVSVEEAKKRDIVEKVSANGKIQPETDVKISPEVSGKILEIAVKEGDHVKAGDLLMVLNPDLLEANVNRSSASLNTAKANLANAKARLAQAKAQFTNTELSYQRNSKLFKDGVISKAEMDQAESGYQTALAEKTAAQESVNASSYNVRSAQATRKEASDNLLRTTIFAPTDGVITALQVEEGETVLGTIQMAGTEVMRVSDLALMEVDVEVNESDIVKVQLGDTADVEVDAYQDKIFTGLVTEIANAAMNSSIAQSTDQVTNFSVKIRILPSSYEDVLADNPGMTSPFKTGMSATVDIRTASKKDVVSIPIEAVTTRSDTTAAEGFEEKLSRMQADTEEDEEEHICVFRYAEGVAKIAVVKTGLQDNRHIEILSGIEEGEEIIVGPYATVSRELEHNDDVELKEEEEEE